MGVSLAHAKLKRARIFALGVGGGYKVIAKNVACTSISKPNSIVKFVSPTKVQVNNNVRPLFKKLLEDCPEELVPTSSMRFGPVKGHTHFKS